LPARESLLPRRARSWRKDRRKIQRTPREPTEGSTFGECAKDYIEANKAGWKNEKHLDQWRMTLLGINPKGGPATNDYCKSITVVAT
jgi:hypothetical protein